MTILTAGQERIRQIVQFALPEYLKTKRDTYEQALLFMRLRASFERDHLICNDSITGQTLGYTRIAQSYCLWIERHCSSTSDEVYHRFPVDNVIYDYGIRSESMAIPAYYGGVGGFLKWILPSTYTEPFDVDQTLWFQRKKKVPKIGLDQVTSSDAPKWATTYWTLFELAQYGRTPTTDEALSLVYYPEYGILKAGSGGNHRLLAHVLWGQEQIFYSRLTCYHPVRPFDDDLNEALVQIEQSLCTAWWDPRKSEFGSLPTVVPFFTFEMDERNAIIHFVNTTTEIEFLILRAYILHCKQRELDIVWLRTQREELRMLHGSSSLSLKKRLAQTLEKIQGYGPITSNFALWYSQNNTSMGRYHL